MRNSQTAFGRCVRSVCIVTQLPVRLQEKIAKAHKPCAQIVRIGSTVLFVTLSATGEIVIEVDPP
jgi:hypothetical protein